MLSGNVRELEGAIISLIAQSSFNKKEVTIDLAKSVVEKFVKNVKREISIDYIQKIVSDYFQLDLEILQSKTRKRHVVQARQLAMFFAKKRNRFVPRPFFPQASLKINAFGEPKGSSGNVF